MTPAPAQEAHVEALVEGANEPTLDPLRAALQGLAGRAMAASDALVSMAETEPQREDHLLSKAQGVRLMKGYVDEALRSLAAHPEPEREDSVVERVRAALAFTDPENGVSCGGLSLDAPGCFAGDLAARVQAAIAPPVAHQDTEREGGMVENLCPCASPSYSHLPSQHVPTPPAVPETDEAAALGELLALVAGYDGCHQRVREYDALPEVQRNEFSDPGSDREDVEWWNRRAQAVLDAGYRKQADR